MRNLLAVLFFGVAASAAAVSKYTPAEAEVLAELSSRSKIPESELRQIISNCDANQQAMNLCAFRDLVVADIVLKHGLAVWKKNRDVACEKQAEHAWHDGSMKPTVRATCVALATKKMIRVIENAGGK